MFAEELDVFLNSAEFSVPATLPGGAVVHVIFDSGHGEALGAGLFEVCNPTALGKTADLSSLGHGSELEIAAVAWRVVGVQPDGTGMTRLILERAS